MAKGKGTCNVPNTPGETAAFNQSAHIPFGKQMLDQSEKGRDQMVSTHRKVQDHGAFVRTAKHPYAKASPIEGSVDLPYSSPAADSD